MPEDEVGDALLNSQGKWRCRYGHSIEGEDCAPFFSPPEAPEDSSPEVNLASVEGDESFGDSTED